MSRGNLAAAALETTRVGAMLRVMRPWRGVLIFNHHRVGPDPGAQGRGLWSGTPEQLKEQLAFMCQHFDVVAPDELDPDTGGRGARVMLTFDDGYRECHELVRPILRAHGVRAAF